LKPVQYFAGDEKRNEHQQLPARRTRFRFAETHHRGAAAGVEGFCGNMVRYVDAFAGAVLALMVAGTAAAAPKATYLARCSMCHQANAQGLAGQFPRLAGRSAQIAQTPEGRHYLARVVLHGMYGSIAVDGQSIAGLMPSMTAMTDAEIADALNHAITAGKPAKPAAPFKPGEIAAVRAEGKASGSDNAALRQQLVASGVIK
jgi:mono/diheme cytochrome c family protein